MTSFPRSDSLTSDPPIPQNPDLTECVRFLSNYLAGGGALKDSISVWRRADLSALIPLCSFRKDQYCRTVIHYEEAFRILLIGWQPRQETPWHDHPSGGCILKLLRGRLQENQLDDARNRKTCYLNQQEISYVEGEETHQIRNGSESEPAVSLHIYSPGNEMLAEEEREFLARFP